MQMHFTRLLIRNRAVAMCKSCRESKRGEMYLTGYMAKFRFNDSSLPAVLHRSSSRRNLRERDCSRIPITRWKRVRRPVPRVEKIHLRSIKARRVTTRSRAKVDTEVETSLYEPGQYRVGVPLGRCVKSTRIYQRESTSTRARAQGR